jgi:hypothetical protein
MISHPSSHTPKPLAGLCSSYEKCSLLDDLCANKQDKAGCFIQIGLLKLQVTLLHLEKHSVNMR